LQVYAVLAQTCNLPARASRQHLMGTYCMPCRRTTLSLSRSALEDTRARPDGYHDGWAARWYLCTLIARSSCPRGTWQPRSCLVSGGGSWSPGGMWRSQSCPMPGDKSRGHGACGSPGATVGPVAGVGAMTHVAVSELACARSESRGHGARGGSESGCQANMSTLPRRKVMSVSSYLLSKSSETRVVSPASALTWTIFMGTSSLPEGCMRGAETEPHWRELGGVGS
jgi:hypothetical protein